MAIQNWYPGHMTRARRKIEADLKLVDLVIELLDARAPYATQNPDIRRLCKDKQRLVLLNKSDLADSKVTALWIDSFKAEGASCIALDSRKRDSIDRIRKATELLAKEKRERDQRRGITGLRPLKAMILGIPNVGKSTFINSMLGKASAKTGNKPGVTRGNQWVNVNNELLLLDTPGVLWPKFDDQHTAEALAEIGAISDDVFNHEDLVIRLLSVLNRDYQDLLFARYDITKEALLEKLSENEDLANATLGVEPEPLALLDLIAAKRGAIKKGGVPDYARAAKLVIDDFRSGRIGQISLERPGTIESTLG